MYTQCPDCGTVFKVTADALRAAQGAVRCGICSTSFSALDYLSERPLLRPHDEEPPHDDTITVEELPGTEFIELSSVGEPSAEPSSAPGGDDSASGPTPPVGSDGAEEEPGRAAADVQQDGDPHGDSHEDGDADADAGDDDDDAGDADAILEFHGSAEDLDRLFIERHFEVPRIGAAQTEDVERSISEISASDLSGIEVIEEALPDDGAAAPETAHPGEVAAVLAFPRHGRDDTGDDDSREDFSDPLSRTDEYPVLRMDEPSGGDPEGEGHGDRRRQGDDEVLQILIPAELRRAAAQSHPPADAFAEGHDREAPAGRRWPLVAGLLVLLLAIAAQATHFWRAELVRHPYLGPWLLRAYSAAGLELQPPVDLSAFELTQLGATNDPVQAGRLKVRASIVNRAPFAQPYPLLRLSLQDRFGTTVGVRNLEPAEYLPGGAAGALLAPSRRADAEVVFVDPGRDAVGYELDVCLRDATGIRCSAELTGRRP